MAQIIVVVLLLLAAAPAWADPPVAKIDHRKYKGGDLHESCTPSGAGEVCDGIVTWKNGTQQEIHNGKEGKFLPRTFKKEAKALPDPNPPVDGGSLVSGPSSLGRTTESAAYMARAMLGMARRDTPTVVIDDYALITPQQVTAWGGIVSATNKVQLAVDAMNDAHLHAGLNVQQRLVGVAQYELNQGTTWDADFKVFVNRYLAGTYAAQRAATGFDTITLFTTQNAWCGQAYVFSFSLPLHMVQGNCSTGNRSYAHECGHTMGLCHNAGDASCVPAAICGPTGVGYGESKFRTPMSYSGGPRTSQWSAPPPMVWFSNGTSPVGTTATNATRCIGLTAATVEAWHARVIPIGTTNPHTAPTALTWTSSGVLSGTTVAGTLTWTHVRPADLAKYALGVDAVPVVNLGLPATNSSPLALTVGSHTVTLSACYVDLTCLPVAITPTVAVNTALIYTALTPADGASFAKATTSTTGVPIRITVTDNSGITYAKVHWTGPTGDKFTWTMTHVGNDYAYNVVTNSPANNRTWSIEIKAVDGEIVNTPVRTVVVTP